jgi:hypothetical protein
MEWGDPADCGMYPSFALVQAGYVYRTKMLMCNADYKIYEQVVNATHRFTNIFYNVE